MNNDLLRLPATELIEGYRTARFSPVEVCRATFDAIAALNPTLNAFQHLDEDGALLQARRSQERWSRGAPIGALDGVPATVKDNILTKGWPTLSGSRTVDPQQAWEEDAPGTARLREAGAVLIGKTTMPEFAWKVMTDSPLFGITRNPWNPGFTPGGSSGGAAAATAAGLGVLALASDGGGSIRVPASRCGLVGLKPTHGRVADYPPSRFGTNSNIGPITRTVRDCALMMNVIARPDPRDWYGLPPHEGDYLDALAGGVKGLRLAWSPDLGSGVAVDPEVAMAAHKAVEVFRALGAQVDEIAIDPALYALGSRSYFVLRCVMQAGLLRALPPARLPLMDPYLLASCRENDFDVVAYSEAEQDRRRFGVALNLLLDGYDALVCPTIQSLPEPVEAKTPEPFLTAIFNASRHPAISIPCGLSSAGLPIGVQLVAAHSQEAKLLRIAAAFEAEHGFAPLPIGPKV
ncbi:amidase family protein [Variovorax sp. dw_308]|uniref:amidase family protein n=1 Tax=Variovorax sp. dw_308 TaxID=2721546 RepID=UPI001C45A942|nr:amidase family protein [Variovorax sp. dw_308]